MFADAPFILETEASVRCKTPQNPAQNPGRLPKKGTPKDGKHGSKMDSTTEERAQGAIFGASFTSRVAIGQIKAAQPS